MSDPANATKYTLAFRQDGSDVKTLARAEVGGKKRHSCRPLPIRFRRKGFSYWQIAREGNAAIYEQTWSGCSDPSFCYEVIRIRRRDGFQIGRRFVEPAEVYPNSEAWGVDGFTLADKDAAFGKLRKVVESSNPLARCDQEEADRTEKSPT
jgi:hypothetical protein